MKFRFAFEGTDKRIVLTPENDQEALLLGTLAEKNGTGVPGDPTVGISWTDDRVPYKKVTEINIVF